MQEVEEITILNYPFICWISTRKLAIGDKPIKKSEKIRKLPYMVISFWLQGTLHTPQVELSHAQLADTLGWKSVTEKRIAWIHAILDQKFKKLDSAPHPEQILKILLAEQHCKS
jgi:hypothetical protein